MNCKGILRKTASPIRKRNLSTHLVNTRQTIDNVQLIDHNHVSDSGDNFDDGFHSRISTKYQISTINTTQKTKNKLQQLKNLTVKDATLAELSPRSKGVVAEKALKKLNIESDKKVYKHLPPVNVNDSVLEVNRVSRRDKKITSSGVHSSIDTEPTLQKYLKPSKPLEHYLELNDLDEIFDENLDRQKLANDNFQQFYEVYRKYLDPTKSSTQQQHC